MLESGANPENMKTHPEGNANGLSVLDLFAGAGGFSLGFQLAGCSIIGAIEQDKWAAETFAFNHPTAKLLVAEIEKLSDLEIRGHYQHLHPDIVLGGPPCQGFSVCRSSEAGDPTDPRNSLFREFLRVVELLNPQIVLMENVPNLVKSRTHSNESVLKIMERNFLASDILFTRPFSTLLISGFRKSARGYSFWGPALHWLCHSQAQRILLMTAAGGICFLIPTWNVAQHCGTQSRICPCYLLGKGRRKVNIHSPL